MQNAFLNELKLKLIGKFASFYSKLRQITRNRRPDVNQICLIMFSVKKALLVGSFYNVVLSRGTGSCLLQDTEQTVCVCSVRSF